MKRIGGIIAALLCFATTLVASPAEANTRCMDLKHDHLSHPDNRNPEYSGLYLARSIGSYFPFTTHKEPWHHCATTST